MKKLLYTFAFALLISTFVGCTDEEIQPSKGNEGGGVIKSDPWEKP